MARGVEERNYSDGLSVGRRKEKKKKRLILTGELWLGPAQKSM